MKQSIQEHFSNGQISCKSSIHSLFIHSSFIAIGSLDSVGNLFLGKHLHFLPHFPSISFLYHSGTPCLLALLQTVFCPEHLLSTAFHFAWKTINYVKLCRKWNTLLFRALYSHRAAFHSRALKCQEVGVLVGSGYSACGVKCKQSSRLPVCCRANQG